MNTTFSCFEASYNPFALMVDRDGVLAAMHRSDQLNALASHVFHPLGELSASDDEPTHGTAETETETEAS